MRRLLAAATLLALAAPAAIAGTVTVITSFPKELTAAYKAAFEKRNPAIKLEILTRTRSRRSPSCARPPRASGRTCSGQRAGCLRGAQARPVARQGAEWPTRRCREDRQLPDQRSEGFYFGQALAGYGIMHKPLPEGHSWRRRRSGPTCSSRSGSATSR